MDKKIKKIIKKYELDITQNLDLEELYRYLEEEELVNFTVYGRENSSGSDFWFQAEYYDNDLGYTIIVDYDYDMSPDKVSDIVKQIEYINKKIKKIKSRIIKK